MSTPNIYFCCVKGCSIHIHTYVLRPIHRVNMSGLLMVIDIHIIVYCPALSEAHLIFKDADLRLELVHQCLALCVRERGLAPLQLLLQARDVVLSKLNDHAAGVDELLLLGPGLLQLGHLLEQQLGAQ